LYEDLDVQPQKEGNSLQLQESLTWAEEFFSKTNGFQKGNKPWNKGIDLEFDNNLKIEKCKRLEHNDYNSYVHENLNGVLSIHNVDVQH
jgi:hypothetical protein